MDQKSFQKGYLGGIRLWKPMGEGLCLPLFNSSKGKSIGSSAKDFFAEVPIDSNLTASDYFLPQQCL